MLPSHGDRVLLRCLLTQAETLEEVRDVLTLRVHEQGFHPNDVEVVLDERGYALVAKLVE